MSHRRMQNKDALLTEDEKRKFRSIVGQLSWISTQTRPDVAFDICELSQLYSRANVGDLVRVNKTVQRVKTDPIKLMYHQLKNLDCFLEFYADASFGNLADGGSQGGTSYFFLVVLVTDALFYADASFGNLADGGSQGGTSYFFLVVLVTDALFHGNQGN